MYHWKIEYLSKIRGLRSIRKTGYQGAYTILFITDALTGIEEEVKQIYPRADLQLCTVHASRNLETHVRVQDRNEIDNDLKGIFLSRTREEAIDQFNAFKNK